MLTPSKLALAGMAGLLLVALPAVAQKAKAKPVKPLMEYATLVNSGSTNTTGYTVTLYQKADAPKVVWIQMPNSEGGVKTNDVTLVRLCNNLFRDLDAAMPLSALPVRIGVRSVSFGTSAFITYKGQKSPDLTFASDPRAAALKADIDGITKLLHIGNSPRRPLVLHLNQSNTH